MVVGFLLGFIFSNAVIEKLTTFFQGSGGALPSQVPLITDLLIAGGGLGIFIVLILAIFSIKTAKFFSTFAIWLILGIISSMVLSFFGMRISEIIINLLPI